MEGHCSTGQSPQWAVVPMEEEEGYKTKVSVSPKWPIFKTISYQILFILPVPMSKSSCYFYLNLKKYYVKYIIVVSLYNTR